ncbi:MAG: exodeoxyribonuclease VII large subunit, partial [Alistipes sp.]|nr:exodeoxyribonuclease VII large subunit [Alistipes sp.]
MSSRKTITLSQLQRQVKQTLTEQFALPVWVSAEISELKVNYAGHCYLELIEKGEEDAVPKAQARATIWRNRYPHVSSYFEAETGQPLTAGIRILAQVLVSYHELYGFSLQINDIDPAFTLGEMERQKNATIRRLQEEGVWEMNRQVELPAVVQRLAVVSSAKAAGFQDFINELKKSRYAFHTTLFEAVMQGLSAEESIIDALGRVADRMEQFDAVVIVRGGGSQSDLSCFNAYRLSTHVAQFPLPVLTGIGHDKDQSVVDMVAASPHKTPTAVAAWLVERMANLEGWLEGAATQLHETTLRHLREAALGLERMSGELHRTTKET